MKQEKTKKKGIIIAGISAIVLIAVLGVSFAFWNYSRTNDNQVLVAGDIFMKYTETNQLVLKNALPSKEPGVDDYFEFKITGKNTYSKPIWYEIVLNHGVENPEGRTERLLDEFLMFRLVEIKGEEEQTVVDNASYEDITSKKIWVNTIPAGTKDNIEITYKLYMWISFDTKIGNTEGNDYDMETWNNQVYASVRVSVNGDFEKKRIKPDIKYPESAQKIIDNTNENNSIMDEDNVVYLSGTNEDINFNYVWYSGKLWRITAINPDGTMKMITQDAITVIHWENNSYKDSWVYSWLNEDFKDTLYNYQNIIVQNVDWNASIDENDISVKPETLEDQVVVQGDIGLLNAYEYYQSYKNLGTDTTAYGKGYLVNGYYWWLINAGGYKFRNVDSWGGHQYGGNSNGVRPSVNLKSDIQLSGEGTKSNPYTIAGDKPTGKPGELINTRNSGEYVRVDNKVYRIVGIENKTTKLTSVDYVRDENGEVLKKHFSSRDGGSLQDETMFYGSEATMDTEYWAGYLNNTWLTDNLRTYITEGTYYLGEVNNLTSFNYKNSICSEINTSETTKNCTKTSKTWTGLVGLPRYGEMFSNFPNSASSYMWLITPYWSNEIWYVNYYGILDYNGNYTYNIGACPSINLKSTIKITGGKGTEQDPYEVALPE